ncbi:MAG: beta-ketoacyl synthase [Flavobacteriaceae bacterium]|nr:beta-ketoacyl synthase [Flavobacteriaceae bacterium]
MEQPIAITGLHSISALGGDREVIWEVYKSGVTKIHKNTQKQWVASLEATVACELHDFLKKNLQYKNLDKTVIMAIITAGVAVQEAGWHSGDDFGINLGSSRGATTLFEKYHQQFLEDGRTALLSSPTTTLGNIATWVAQDLQSKGPEISHSITCSTALHAVMNGIAWLRSGMTKKFLVGGSEAPLTPFTIAQMQALKVYSKRDDDYPCRAMDLKKTANTMVLGEGAAMACLELGKQDNALAYIVGVGYATEQLSHAVSVSKEADCFQQSMEMALRHTDKDAIDVVVMHAPGTIRGDVSEYKAIENVFGNQIPCVTTNKWQLGHTFGASGMLSLELAVLMLQRQQFVPVPFLQQEVPSKIQQILVNAVGFGGNAVSVLLERA